MAAMRPLAGPVGCCCCLTSAREQLFLCSTPELSKCRCVCVSGMCENVCDQREEHLLRYLKMGAVRAHNTGARAVGDCARRRRRGVLWSDERVVCISRFSKPKYRISMIARRRWSDRLHRGLIHCNRRPGAVRVGQGQSSACGGSFDASLVCFEGFAARIGRQFSGA